MDALERMEVESLLSLSPIKSIEDLMTVLKLQQETLHKDIQQLALSVKPEDNYTRLGLIGKLELVNNLLVRIIK